jgi:hypothetical protein
VSANTWRQGPCLPGWVGGWELTLIKASEHIQMGFTWTNPLSLVHFLTLLNSSSLPCSQTLQNKSKLSSGNARVFSLSISLFSHLNVQLCLDKDLELGAILILIFYFFFEGGAILFAVLRIKSRALSMLGNTLSYTPSLKFYSYYHDILQTIHTCS